MHPNLQADLDALPTKEIMGVQDALGALRRRCAELHPLARGTLNDRLAAVNVHLDVERHLLPRDTAVSRIKKLRALRMKLLNERL